MTPSIRLATNTDTSALHALVERAYRGESATRGWTHEAHLLGGQRTDVAALGEALADPASRLLVADDAGEIVGSVQVSAAGLGTSYLGMLSVDPDRQSAGLGRRLIAAAEATAITAFASTAIEMTVIAQRSELIDYYVRRGYVRTGEERPFPLDDERVGLPKTRALKLVVLCKALGAADVEALKLQRDAVRTAALGRLVALRV